MKLTLGNLKNHLGEHFHFSELSKNLQKECAESLLEHFDVDGYGWHEYADEEEYCITEDIQEKGFAGVKIHSTQSFCCQGDSTCVSVEAIGDFDKFWENHGKDFSGKHDKWILKNLLSFNYSSDDWRYNSSDLNMFFEKDNCNVYGICYDDWKDRWPRLYDRIDSIFNVLSEIFDELDHHAYNKMRAAFDCWYSAENIRQQYSDDDVSVWYDGDCWQSQYIRKTWTW